MVIVKHVGYKLERNLAGQYNFIFQAVYVNFRESSSIVTGPSLTISTCIMAPNTPSNSRLKSFSSSYMDRTFLYRFYNSSLPLIFSGLYAFPSFARNFVYISLASAVFILEWKSGLLPTNLPLAQRALSHQCDYTAHINFFLFPCFLFHYLWLFSQTM